MVIKPELRNILEVIGDLSHHDVNTNVVDTSVAQHNDRLPSLEVYDCLEELESLGLIKMLQPIGDTKEKMDDQTFRLLNITKEGLEELQSTNRKLNNIHPVMQGVGPPDDVLSHNRLKYLKVSQFDKYIYVLE